MVKRILLLVAISGCAPKGKLIIPEAFKRQDAASKPTQTVRITAKDRTVEVPLEMGNEGYRVEVPVENPSTPESKAKTPENSTASMANVHALYLAGKFDLALQELTQLEAKTPEDVRLLSMKGTLFLKLKNRAQAREAWEKALSLQPDNENLLEALRVLDESEGKP